MSRYKIIGIVLLSLIVIIVITILSTGSMLINSPVMVILATIDFIGTEQEFRDLVESTEEAKLFRETFPNTITQYHLEIGKRTIVFLSKSSSYDATIHFRQNFDRTMHISYWCHLGDESSFGKVNSIDKLKESSCF